MRKLFVRVGKSKQLELMKNHKFEVQSRCSDKKKIYHYWIGKIKRFLHVKLQNQEAFV